MCVRKLLHPLSWQQCMMGAVCGGLMHGDTHTHDMTRMDVPTCCCVGLLFTLGCVVGCAWHSQPEGFRYRACCVAVCSTEAVW